MDHNGARLPPSQVRSRYAGSKCFGARANVGTNVGTIITRRNDTRHNFLPAAAIMAGAKCEC